MPEYLAPGVYVVEVASGIKPIEGVKTSNTTLRNIARDITRNLGAGSPLWTDLNHSDPGVTLLELFAWLTELLVLRTNALPECGSRHASRLAAAALALIAGREPKPGSPFKAVRFFDGRLLVETDLLEEQNYYQNRKRMNKLRDISRNVMKSTSAKRSRKHRKRPKNESS